ncbi:MAG: hypothetical protein IKX18_03095, partial [Muribaculaceae bacterium]|nr:hypothetical protein [Muribaculaceae bacterium]
MKTTNQLSILACLLFIVISWATPAYAVWDHQWIDGIPYDNYDADAHTVSVSMYSSAPQGIYHFKGNYITIPGSVLYNGVRCTVNEIEHTAFPSCAPTIKTFSVPSTVKKIGSDIKWIGSVYLKSSDAVINKTSFSGLSKVFVPEGCGDFYRSQLDSAEYNKIVDSFKASGQLFAGSGSGTKDDPYLIFNPIQLNQVRHFLNEKYVHFRLMSDIDLSDWLADNNPSQGWQPIGTESSPFMGIFDGNNHKITGLRINRSTTDNVGFFGFMLWADIFNLTLEGSEIKGGLYVGSLAGQLIDCNIGNCSITIDTITGEDYTGGLAGCGSGDIINCKSYVSVNGNNRTGGFIGSSQN